MPRRRCPYPPFVAVKFEEQPLRFLPHMDVPMPRRQDAESGCCTWMCQCREGRTPRVAAAHGCANAAKAGRREWSTSTLLDIFPVYKPEHVELAAISFAMSAEHA